MVTKTRIRTTRPRVLNEPLILEYGDWKKSIDKLQYFMSLLKTSTNN
jgi:hypothetical protein